MNSRIENCEGAITVVCDQHKSLRQNAICWLETDRDVLARLHCYQNPLHAANGLIKVRPCIAKKPKPLGQGLPQYELVLLILALTFWFHSLFDDLPAIRVSACFFLRPIEKANHPPACGLVW